MSSPAEVTGQPLVENSKLPLSIVLVYGLPAIGLSLPNMLLGLYFFKFATDVLYVAPGVLGLLFGLSRLWDAVSDPVAGYYSDRTQSPMGRRRPWMLAGAFALAISIVLLWVPPASLEGIWITLWVGVGLLLMTTASTVFGVPYGALGAELTTDHHDRTRLFAYRSAIGGVGTVLALGAFYLLMEAEKPAESWLGLPSREVALGIAILGSVLALGSILTLVAVIRERPDYQTRGPDQIFRAFYDVFSNRHARQLLFVFTVQTFGTASMGLLAAYLFQYILKTPNWMAAVLIAGFVVPMAISIPFWVRISRRFGKARCYTATLWTLGVLYCLVYFGLRDWGFEDNPQLIVLSIPPAGVLGVVSACGFVVAPSIKADVIDFDEYQTNQRKEGAYLAAWSFVQKSAAALAAVLLGAVLQFVGYTPGAEQSGPTQFAIMALISFVPGIGFLVAAIVFGRFDLDEAEHARIRAELDARALATTEP
ncbi:MAG: MFS transporter [Myxococcales bacterium]|nr:MFS transporter [Myxococcales bacterium]